MSAKAQQLPGATDGVVSPSFTTDEQRPRDASKATKEPLSRAAMIFALMVLLPVAGAVFAAMSVNQGSIANDQSQVANQIALLSLCFANSSTSFCSKLLDQADTIIPALGEKLYDTTSSAGHPPHTTLRDSEGGKPFLLASLITFWVFLAASMLCTLWFSVETIWRWRHVRLAHKGLAK